MNFDEYFSKRNELTIRVLTDVPDASAESPDARFAAIGASCLALAVALTVWASITLTDAGYFARTATFFEFLLLAGASILIATNLANAWVPRLRVKTREALKERTVVRLIDADRAIARKLAGRAG